MQREPLAPQKVSQTLLLPFVISLIASQCAPDPSLFFFFSPENNTFIMGYLHVCKCRTAACLQKLKQASSNKIVRVVQWQGRNLVSRSSLGSQQEQLREMRSSSDWCLQVIWKALVLVCAENFVWQQRNLSRDGNAPLRGRHCPSWRVSGAPGSHQRAKLNAGQ